GSRNEVSGQTGSAHLLEHMLFKGSTKYNDANGNGFWSTMHRLGASCNAGTSFDWTIYHETLPAEFLSLAIGIEADRMRNALIRESDHATEMTVVRNELERGQNSQSTVLSFATRAAAFSRHPYHHPVIGWRSDVEGVTTADLRSFYNSFYQPNNAVVAVVGQFDERDILSALEQAFGSIKTSENVPQVYTEELPQSGALHVELLGNYGSTIVNSAF